MNFAPAPTRIPIAEMVATVESGLVRVPEEPARLARIKIIGALSKAKPPSVNLLPQERRSIKSLQQDDQIFVLSADKGRATVVMDKNQYDEKMTNFLDDRKTYIQETGQGPDFQPRAQDECHTAPHEEGRLHL